MDYLHYMYVDFFLFFLFRMIKYDRKWKNKIKLRREKRFLLKKALKKGPKLGKIGNTLDLTLTRILTLKLTLNLTRLLTLSLNLILNEKQRKNLRTYNAVHPFLIKPRGGTLKWNKNTGDCLWSIFELLLFSKSGFVFYFFKYSFKNQKIS